MALDTISLYDLALPKKVDKNSEIQSKQEKLVDTVEILLYTWRENALPPQLTAWLDKCQLIYSNNPADF